MDTDPVPFEPIDKPANRHADDVAPVPEIMREAGGDGASLAPEAESTVWSGRTNWRHFAGSLSLASVIVIAIWAILSVASSKWGLSGSASMWIGFVVAVVVMGLAGGRAALHVLQCRYRVTTQRLFIERGILSQTIDQTELIRVDDVRVRKRLVDRIFGLGTVEILSTDTSDKSVIIEGVKDPEQIAEHIRVRMRTLRSKSLFVENL